MWFLFIAVRSVVPGVGLALVVSYAVWRAPRLRAGAYAASLIAVAAAALLWALTLRAESQAASIDEPLRLGIIGVQAEEVLWPAFPIGFAAALLAPLLGLWRPKPRAETPQTQGQIIRWRLLDVTALGVLLGIGVWLYQGWPMMPWSAGGWGNAAFDPVRWQQAGDELLDNPRGTMVRSLLRSGALRGQCREEVVALLGPPDGETPDYVEYIVGGYSGFGVDEDSLLVYFGGDDMVEGWALVQY